MKTYKEFILEKYSTDEDENICGLFNEIFKDVDGIEFENEFEKDYADIMNKIDKNYNDVIVIEILLKKTKFFINTKKYIGRIYYTDDYFNVYIKYNNWEENKIISNFYNKLLNSFKRYGIYDDISKNYFKISFETNLFPEL